MNLLTIELNSLLHVISVISFSAFVTVLFLPKIKEYYINKEECTLQDGKKAKINSNITITFSVFKNGDPGILIVSANKKEESTNSKLKRIIIKNKC